MFSKKNKLFKIEAHATPDMHLFGELGTLQAPLFPRPFNWPCSYLNNHFLHFN
jgi:hypothetical protein